jgi:transposase-like protein
MANSSPGQCCCIDGDWGLGSIFQPGGKTMTFTDILSQFPTEESAIEYFNHVRYHGDKVHCNHCGSTRVYSRKGKGKLYGCLDCHSTFSPFAGTLFEGSPTDFRKWLYALYLVRNGNGSVSTRDVSKELGVEYRTAERMINKIRTAMDNGKE